MLRLSLNLHLLLHAFNCEILCAFCTHNYGAKDGDKIV